MRGSKRRGAPTDENAGRAKKAKVVASQTAHQDAKTSLPLERKPLSVLVQPENSALTDIQVGLTASQKQQATHQAQCQKFCWKDVPSGVLSKIAAKLSSIDFTNIRLICKMWREAVDGSILTLQRDRAWTSAELVRAAALFPAVTTLDMQDSSLLTHGRGLIGMKNLKSLRLVRLKMICPSGEWCFVSKLTQLQCLVLNKFDAVKRISLVGFSQLQRLDLSTCVQLETVSTRITLPCLTSLSLRECRSLSIWRFLRHMPGLRALDVSYCPLFGCGAATELAACQRLETLVAQRCSAFDDAGLAKLLHLGGLRNVYVDGCWHLTERAIEAARTAKRDGVPHLNIIKFSI